MDERIKAFSDVYQSSEGKEILALGEKIKKLDKANEKRTLVVIIMSMITMTFLGFYAFGVIGAVLFFSITAIASFWLFYTSKKNVLLKYLTFYRTRIPKMIATAEGIDVKSEEIPYGDFVSSLSDKGKLSYRMCHKYGDIYIGFAKFTVNGEPILQGVIYCCTSNTDDVKDFDQLLEQHFEEHVIKVENNVALLFLPWVNDYLDGRVEKKDDLTFPALVRQYDYYLLGKKFYMAVNGEGDSDTTVFHEVE